MVKLALISVIVSMVALPVVAAKDPSPRRGLKRAFAFTVVFTFIYLATLKLVAMNIIS